MLYYSDATGALAFTRAVVYVAFAFVAGITIIESSETVYWFIMQSLELIDHDGAWCRVVTR
jgi:hypothetical protein